MAIQEGETIMAATTFKRSFGASASTLFLFSMFALIAFFSAQTGSIAAKEDWREIALPSNVIAQLPGVNDAVVVNGKLILSVWGGQKVIVYEPAKPGLLHRDRSRIADVLSPVDKSLMLTGGGIAVASSNILLLALNGHIYKVPIDTLKPYISADTQVIGFTRFTQTSDLTRFGIGLPFVPTPKDGVTVWELTPKGRQAKFKLPLPKDFSGVFNISDICADQNSI